MLGGIFGLLGRQPGMLGTQDPTSAGAGGPSAYAMKGGGLDVMGTLEQVNQGVRNSINHPGAAGGAYGGSPGNTYGNPWMD